MEPLGWLEPLGFGELFHLGIVHLGLLHSAIVSGFQEGEHRNLNIVLLLSPLAQCQPRVQLRYKEEIGSIS